MLLRFDICIVLVHLQLRVAAARTCTHRDGHSHGAESPKYNSSTLMKKKYMRRDKKNLTSLVNMTYACEGKLIILYMSIRFTDF